MRTNLQNHLIQTYIDPSIKVAFIPLIMLTYGVHRTPHRLKVGLDKTWHISYQIFKIQKKHHLLYCSKLIGSSELISYIPEYEDIFNDNDPEEQ